MPKRSMKLNLKRLQGSIHAMQWRAHILLEKHSLMEETASDFYGTLMELENIHSEMNEFIQDIHVLLHLKRRILK